MKIEVPHGDIVDKMTILRIKETKISDSIKLKNIRTEIEHLMTSFHEIGITESCPKYLELLNVNQKIWDGEDLLREQESRKKIEDDFINIARSIRLWNEERCDIKRVINIETSSSILEEKNYTRVN
jgi:hypothetical protein|tara:strand:- start:819 stop:1196 length:378 start_codon:yes stop_codon:yes gene_type:complete